MHSAHVHMRVTHTHARTHVVAQGDDGAWVTDVAVRQPWTKVEGWALPEQPPLITDILIRRALLESCRAGGGRRA